MGCVDACGKTFEEAKRLLSASKPTLSIDPN